MNCPLHDKLQAYIDLQLDSDFQIKSHIDSCASCQENIRQRSLLSEQLKKHFQQEKAAVEIPPLILDEEVKVLKGKTRLVHSTWWIAAVVVFGLILFQYNDSSKTEELTVFESQVIWEDYYDANQPSYNQDFVIEQTDSKGNKQAFIL